MKEVQPGIFRFDGSLYTRTSNSDEQVYGEQLVKKGGDSYRLWSPSRSKLAAAVKAGAELGIERDSEIVYLGAAAGTTVSHLSDIVSDGFLTAVEVSREAARGLVSLAEDRENIAPVIADARKPQEYAKLVEKPDILVQDISQRDQVSIFERNAESLFESGRGLLVVKASAIDSGREPEEVFEEVEGDISLKVEDSFRLSPHYSDHKMYVLNL